MTALSLTTKGLARKGVVKNQDYHDPGYKKQHTQTRWALGHWKVHQATTYHDYQDIHGDNNSDTLANMGDTLPMDLPLP